MITFEGRVMVKGFSVMLPGSNDTPNRILKNDQEQAMCQGGVRLRQKKGCWAPYELGQTPMHIIAHGAKIVLQL